MDTLPRRGLRDRSLEDWRQRHGGHQPVSFPLQHVGQSDRLCYDMRRKDFNYGLARRLFAELKQIGPNYLGDFYPLTPYTLAGDAWMAWQYDRPTRGRNGAGLSPREVRRVRRAFRLGGLDPLAEYEVTDFDGGARRSSPARS